MSALFDELLDLGLDPILVSSADPDQVLMSFAGWTERRLAFRGRRR